MVVSPKSNWFCATLFLAAVAAGALPGKADIFHLAGGGQVLGEWLNREEKGAAAYRVQTAGGAQIVLEVKQVARLERQRPEDCEYQARCPKTPDTVAGHLALAQWCGEKFLQTERAIHLRRVIELEPDHAQARAALGFQKIDGQWITAADAHQGRGYAYYQGRWRLVQEIELMEERARRDQAEKEWLVKLRRWRQQLAGPKARETRELFLAISDSHAVGPLAELLRGERVREAKLLYLETLGKIGGGSALEVLVTSALNDPDVEIFHACADELVRAGNPRLAAPFLAALKDNNNVRVNRAAYVLGQLGDRTLLDPLIEALVTTHRVTHTPAGGNSPDAISTTFASTNDGRGNITPDSSFATGDRSKTQSFDVQNQAVLTALVKLTGGTSHGFDKDAWRKWLTNEKRNAPAVDVRRDGS